MKKYINIYSSLIFLIFYSRMSGKSDDEIYPAKIHKDTLAIEDNRIIFSENSKYSALELDAVDKSSYVPTNNEWQEIVIRLKDHGSYSYHMRASIESLEQSVYAINQRLQINPLDKLQ